jgi:hypothetical protein
MKSFVQAAARPVITHQGCHLDRDLPLLFRVVLDVQEGIFDLRAPSNLFDQSHLL